MWFHVGRRFVHVPSARMVGDICRSYDNYPAVMARVMNLRPFPVIGHWRHGRLGYTNWRTDVELRCMADALFRAAYSGFEALEGGGMAFDYWTGQRFHWVVLNGTIGRGDPISVFYNREYVMPGIRDGYVVDVGGSIGDSPIWFYLMGAQRVYAYEADQVSFELMKKNIEASHAYLVGAVHRRVESFDDIADGMPDARLKGEAAEDARAAPSLLKMDIEGSEYPFFETVSVANLRRFSAIVMEYHYGSGPIMAKLKQAGFRAHASIPVRAKGMVGGIIRAERA